MPDELVQDGELGEVADATLDQTEEVSDNETLKQPSVDAETLKQEFESKLAKSEEDIRKLKSSLQRQISEKEAAWGEKERQYQKELERYQLQNMDEGQRKQYEERRTSEEIQKLYNTIETMQQQNAKIQATKEAISFFLDGGVPASELSLNGDYDELVQSGWNWIFNELKQLRSTTASPKKATSTSKKAPEVVTSTNAPPRKRSWDDLLKKYGDYDTVFSLVESGDLPASVIPVD